MSGLEMEMHQKLEIRRQVILSSTRLQNTSRKERAVRMNVKCTKMKILRARRAKLLFFIIVLIKFVKLMSPSSLRLLNLLGLKSLLKKHNAKREANVFVDNKL